MFFAAHAGMSVSPFQLRARLTSLDQGVQAAAEVADFAGVAGKPGMHPFGPLEEGQRGSAYPLDAHPSYQATGVDEADLVVDAAFGGES